MRNGYPVLVSIVAISTVLTIRGLSQTNGAQQEKSGQLKIKSTEVLVDAVVVDRKNRLVTDLNAQDFQVSEDGTPQDITSFRLVRGNTETEKPAASGAAPTTAVPDTASTEELPNTIIALLDYSTTQLAHTKMVQDAAIKYVEKKMQPNDVMAVFVLGTGLQVACGFTSDKAKLIAGLKKADHLFGTSYASERADLSVTIAEGDLAQNQIVGPAGQKSVDAAIAQNFAAMHIPMRAAIDRLQGLGVLSAIRAIAMGVAPIHGRKTLLMFSEGFVPGPSVELELQSVVGVANRSQLAIYCIESQGLETRDLNGNLLPKDELTNLAQHTGTKDDASQLGAGMANKTGHGGESGFDRAQEVGVDIREGGLRELAISTGGDLFRNSNDLSVGLDHVDREMRTYYLLSYHPKNENLDGQFRQIRVAVKDSGLTVRARSGYFAIPAGYDLLSPAEFQLMQEAGKTTPATSKIPLFMRAGAFQYGKSEFRIPVAIEMPYTAIEFVANGNKHSAELQVLGLVRDSSGTVVQRFGNPLQINVTDAEYAALKVGTIYVTQEAAIATEGAYKIQVLVKDLASKEVATSEQTVYLARPANSLALSTVLLAHGQQLYKVADSPDKFLTVQGVKISPSATCQFRNGENLIFYFDIYNATVDPAKKTPNLSITLKLAHEGQDVNANLPSFDVTDNAGPDAGLTFCRFLRLAGLKPGDYTLVFDVKDAVGNQTARRQTNFTIIN
ncbi:MAG TPA: VWA domain-containing protein [Blastocatellia bacterium]